MPPLPSGPAARALEKPIEAGLRIGSEGSRPADIQRARPAAIAIKPQRNLEGTAGIHTTPVSNGKETASILKRAKLCRYSDLWPNLGKKAESLA
jgi:hypothetical protein